MVEAGCDVIEVGLPYSDPVMDGPTIQAAAQQALEARHPHQRRAAHRRGGRRRPACRRVVMTYWNPVERYGVDRFARDLADAGGAGLITPDLVPDEADEWVAAADAHGLDKVFLVAPSSTDDRLRQTAEACRGFVYADRGDGRHRRPRRRAATWPAPLVGRTRAVTDLPVGVGLGVSDGDQAAEVASLRRRRDRRVGVRAPAARRRRRPGGRAGARWPS